MKKRPMSVFDHSRAMANQTMWNDMKFDVLGNHKLSMNPLKAPLSQQSTIDRQSATGYKNVFKDIKKIQHKLQMRSNVSPDRNYSDATTATASHDERRISIYLRALKEVARSNPEFSSLFKYMADNIETLFHQILSNKKDENKALTQKIEDMKKQVSEERKKKEKAIEMNENLYDFSP